MDPNKTERNATARSSASASERIIWVLVTIASMSFGWMVLVKGSYTYLLKSGAIKFSSGYGAYVMAFTSFLLAFVSISMLLRSLQAKPGIYVAAAFMILLPPLMYYFSPL